MHILGNPILSKTFSRSNLLLNLSGLHYVVKKNKRKEAIFLTNDHKFISNLFLIPERLFDHPSTEDAMVSQLEDFFNYVCISPYFRPEKFHGESIDHLRKVKMFLHFEKFINANGGIEKIIKYRTDNNIGFKPIELDQLKSDFSFLENEIQSIIYWFDNIDQITRSAKAKFTGQVILDAYPKLHKPYIENIFHDLKTAFPSMRKRYTYIINNKIDIILDRFAWGYATDEDAISQ